MNKLDRLPARSFVSICSAVIAALAFAQTTASAAYTPVLHLRKTATPPPLVTTLQDPSQASAWYSCSPTWFGLGGKTGDRNHTEVLATYDSTALYIAFLNIDRSTVLYPRGTTTDITTVDSTGIWIETPANRRFYLMAALDTTYPPGAKQASGEFPAFDPKSDRLSGWSHTGWYAGDKTIQQTIRIPWSALSTSAPIPGSRWRINFVNYNQTSTALSASTVKKQTWAPGTESQPDQWGYLAFDEAVFTAPSDVSPEATLTLRPATGYGDEITLRAGNAADLTNEWKNEAITQSNWNDWDPVDYTIKEFVQFDLSMIPRDREIISATFRSRFRDAFESDPTDLYLHVVGLSAPYDPKTVTMLTSPLPLENGYMRLVKASEAGDWIDFDLTDVVSRAFDSGEQKASFALSGSSGDISNGKIWDTSFGRADYYDQYRPRLIITFGKPGVTYPTPAKVGSTNYTSAATTADKNKLTNGTFRYGTVEGYTNSTYWLDPGSIYLNGANYPLMRMTGDTNPKTGDPAVRMMCPEAWRSMKQIATGLMGGKTYTFSGWYKGSAPGVKSDVRIAFQNSSGTTLSGGQAVYSGSGNWEQVKLTLTAPSGTAKAKVEVFNWTAGTDAYMLYSDFQLEQSSSPTAYSETMGIYYPDHPRTDGTVISTGGNCISANKSMPIGSSLALTGKVVTGAFPGYFYVQESDHPVCGIRVVSTTSVTPGSMVNVSGTLGKNANDELVINAASVTSGTAGGATIQIFATSNRQIGGGTQGSIQGPDGGSGLNTVGVLQTTWGRVSSLVANSSMLISDGSGCTVKVVGPTGPAVNGGYVRVTGIASLEKSGTSHIRVLRTRNAADVAGLGF